MKHLDITLLLAVMAMHLSAQSTDTKIQIKLDEAKQRLEEFNTERMLDSLDQEKLPKLVSGGLLAGVNMSNFIITRDHHMMSSYMRIGGELGGFLDFSVTRHFAIQPQVLFTAHQNYFAVTDSANHLWSFGAEIPIYFLGRFGNLENPSRQGDRPSRRSGSMLRNEKQGARGVSDADCKAGQTYTEGEEARGVQGARL